MATTQTANNKPAPKPATPATPAKDEKKLTPDEVKAVKSARFKKIASGRATAIVKNLQLIENCSNKFTYEYTSEQVEKMFSLIEKALTKAKEKFVEKAAAAKIEKVEL